MIRRTISIHLYSGAELRGLLRRAGLDEVQLCGNVAGAAYGRATDRPGAVATN